MKVEIVKESRNRKDELIQEAKDRGFKGKINSWSFASIRGFTGGGNKLNLNRFEYIESRDELTYKSGAIYRKGEWFENLITE